MTTYGPGFIIDGTVTAVKAENGGPITAIYIQKGNVIYAITPIDTDYLKITMPVVMADTEEAGVNPPSPSPPTP